MRPSHWNAQPSFWNTRPSFWGFNKKLKVQPKLWKARPSVCVITRSMLSQSATGKYFKNTWGQIDQYLNEWCIFNVKRNMISYSCSDLKTIDNDDKFWIFKRGIPFHVNKNFFTRNFFSCKQKLFKNHYSHICRCISPALSSKIWAKYEQRAKNLLCLHIRTMRWLIYQAIVFHCFLKSSLLYLTKTLILSLIT